MDPRPDYKAPEGSMPGGPAHPEFVGPAQEDPAFSPLNFLQIVRRYMWLWIPLTSRSQCPIGPRVPNPSSKR